MNKCYSCKFRGYVPENAHSSCSFVKTYYRDKLDEEELGLLELGLSGNILKFNDEVLKFNQHGIDKGWVNWPLNFDPVWLEVCKFYQKKDES